MTTDRLMELAKAATPGPWDDDPYGLYIFAPSEKGGSFPVADSNTEAPEQVARARGWGYFTGHGGGALGLSAEEGAKRQKANTAYIAAANPAAIITLLTALEEARLALEPFAETAEQDIGSTETDEDIFQQAHHNRMLRRITVGHFRAAKSALAAINAIGRE